MRGDQCVSVDRRREFIIRSTLDAADQPLAASVTGIYLGGHVVGGGMLNDSVGQNPGTTGPTNLVTFGSL